MRTMSGLPTSPSLLDGEYLVASGAAATSQISGSGGTPVGPTNATLGYGPDRQPRGRPGSSLEPPGCEGLTHCGVDPSQRHRHVIADVETSPALTGWPLT
jgi:hypothetical protein